jgi:hypothetical protein
VIPFDASQPHNEAGTRDASADSASSLCGALDEAFALAVHNAQTCNSDGDCSLLVCETLCCNCRVYVNPSAPSSGALMSLTSHWNGLGCESVGVCTPMTCDPPVGAQCSSSHRCVTIRQVGGGG